MWRHWPSNGGSPRLAEDSHGGGNGLLGLDGRPHWWDDLATRWTPTEVGRSCSSKKYSHGVGLAAEVRKTPTGVGCALRPQSERETPTGVGCALRELAPAVSGLACLWRNPHRSGVCFARWYGSRVPTKEKRRNPHRSGVCFASGQRTAYLSPKMAKNPHRSGIHHCHQIVNVLPTTIAHIHQPGHPIKNSLRDPP